MRRLLLVALAARIALALAAWVALTRFTGGESAVSAPLAPASSAADMASVIFRATALSA